MTKIADVAGLVGALLIASACSAQEAQSLPGQTPENAEMRAILAADNSDRPDIVVKDFALIEKADRARRAQVMALLDAGALKNGGDYRAAAFIFQHGSTSRDYLLAHILAMVAVQLGDERAKWIAAASLDRFLMTSGQQQVFGTQYAQQDGPDKPFTQRPYDKALVPDSVRKVLGVKTLQEQEKQLADIEKERAADK